MVKIWSSGKNVISLSTPDRISLIRTPVYSCLGTIDVLLIFPSHGFSRSSGSNGPIKLYHCLSNSRFIHSYTCSNYLIFQQSSEGSSHQYLWPIVRTGHIVKLKGAEECLQYQRHLWANLLLTWGWDLRCIHTFISGYHSPATITFTEASMGRLQIISYLKKTRSKVSNSGLVRIGF